MNIFVLFAPVFQEFGCDIAHQLRKELGNDITIHGLCTGGIFTIDRVRQGLGELSGKLWDLNTEEKKWLENEPDDGYVLPILSKSKEPGAFGRIITSDRRIGNGFVSGGLVPDSIMSTLALSESQIIPRRYVSNLIKFIDDALHETKADAVFCYAVAGAPAVCLAELSAIYSIPFLNFSPCRLGDRFIIDTDSRGRLEPVAKTYLAAQQNSIDLSPWINRAQENLKNFQDMPSLPGYQIYNNKKISEEKLISEIVNAIIRTGNAIIGKILFGEKFTNVRKNSLIEPWSKVSFIWGRKKLQIINPFSVINEPQYPYIYYPLHVDPEASTMVLSPMFTDQIQVIEALAKAAPPEYDIVVKEHAPMLGKRPKGFYKRIKQIPRVTLIGPDYDGLDLIRKATLTVVITGTAAWEAIRLKRPAIVIGDSPYLAIGEGIIHSPCLNELPSKIIEALRQLPASDTNLTLYIAALFKESFEMKTSLLWGNYLEHSAEERTDVSRIIAQNILLRINTYKKSTVEKSQDSI
ncbi:hypothetical protein J2T61_001868 [Methanocalculus sp. AMF5]|uniref:capsular polysaccharide export protein, LipB/KpsS family n=1 Tax=Methanocalculus sp. AMF5 TaxID=1198257 RepID=UPI00209D9BF0|nr:hypothetical protein [Methanocalculus sp. AMF5]MCP1663166.1 hypothetical protein [Methanocalculus sp. AMF5]